MTVYTNLFEQICSFENLYLAYRKARKGKRGAASTASFEYNQEDELLRLRAELSSGEWRPGPYYSFYIHDPKKRLISAAPFRDRVVHHALCNLIEPIWERKFIFDSYANRVGKGTRRALLRANQFARQYKYVLQCDVEMRGGRGLRSRFSILNYATMTGHLLFWLRLEAALCRYNRK